MISLGIDVGTANLKVLALDIESGRTLATAVTATLTRRDADGEVHEPAVILDEVIRLLGGVVGSLERPGDVVAMSVASVGEEVVLLDGGLSPIGDTITWYDPRGSTEAAVFLRGDGGRLPISRRWPPHPTFSLFKLMWLATHRPADMAAAHGWTDVGGFILAGLGGAPVMDWSHASRAGAFDLIARAWDPASIEAAGVGIAFPELVATGTVIGRLSPAVAGRIGLAPDVALVAGGHDHLCAAFGAGVRSEAELFLSAGTSEAHLALLDWPIDPAGSSEAVEQGCYVDERGYYAHVNIHSGHVHRQWRALLYADVPDEEMATEVLAATSADGPVFELLDGQRIGRLDRIPSEATRAQLMRAVAEGLTRRSAAIVDELERVTGSPFSLILAAGHPTRDRLWRTLRHAAYGRPMASVDELESAAFGAAVIAARAVAGADAGHLVAGRTAWG